MRLTLLGTGSTSAPPLYGCECAVCKAARAVIPLARRPASALAETANTRLVLDAGLHDVSQRFPAGSVAAYVLTHFHPDHVQGLFSMRWGIGGRIPVYCPPDTEGCADLYKNPGILDFRPMRKFESFSIGDIHITPVPLIHSKPTLGLCLEGSGVRIAYLTDTAGLPPATADFLRQWMPDELVLDCSYPPMGEAPRNHNDMTLALEVIADLVPRHATLTHIGHELDAWLNAHASELPPRVSIGRDGMVIAP